MITVSKFSLHDFGGPLIDSRKQAAISLLMIYPDLKKGKKWYGISKAITASY